jgi:putative membrane protein insertion efficiency factor
MIIKQFFVFLIKVYQNFISPYLPSSCKYYPTCSQYAIDAIERKGIMLGGVMAIWRILRCNPFSKGGIDEVV